MKSGAVTPKPVILVASYGTAQLEGEKDNEKIDRIFREHFPDNEVRWAFTADHFLQALKKWGGLQCLSVKCRLRAWERCILTW